MKPASMIRSVILSALALAFLLPATCRAQAEVNPDCYPIDNGVATTAASAHLTAVNSAPAATAAFQAAALAPAPLPRQQTISVNLGFGPSAVLIVPTFAVTAHQILSELLSSTASFFRQLSDFLNRSQQADVLC